MTPEDPSVRPEPVEGHSADAERLASGFAEHVVRWARRMQGRAIGEEEEGALLRARPVRPEPVEGPDSPEHVEGADPVGGQSVSPADRDLSILRRAAHEVSLATSNGNVCLLLSDLTVALFPSRGRQPLPPSPSGGGQGWGPLPDPTTLRTILLNSGVVGTPAHPGSLPLILDEDGRLYLHRYFDYEVRLARRLMQAASTPPRTVDAATRDLLNSLFPLATDNEVDWQKIAAAMALRNGLTVISGGPGTGKTTTVVNLLACLLTQEPGTRVALAAPTGKAAARMTETIRQRAEHLPASLRAKLPTGSSTIHRLLGATPGQGRFTYHAGNPLPYDVLIVDEASMLDLAMATRLLEAVPAPARIILLGDKDQLAAVEAGAVFAELSADPTLTDSCRHDLANLCGYAPERVAPPAPAQSSSLHDAAVWLTKNYRFGTESAIGRLAGHINEGRAEEALALLRNARSGQTPGSNATSSPFALSPSKGASANGAAKSKTAKKAGEDTASLSLFPELESPSAAPAAAKGPAPSLDTSIQWLDPEQGDNVLDAIRAGYARYFATALRDLHDASGILQAFAQFRVLCATREGPSGVNALNEQLARHARQILSATTEGRPVDSRSPWFVGRPVIVLHNDYLHKLFNGDIGIALPDANGELAVFFPDGENGYRAVPPVRMPAHETAFAMTVHKAQGSECDGVLVVLPQQRSRVATRELLYTAVTRARSRVTVAGGGDVLASAIESRSRRHSGLLTRLGHAGSAPNRWNTQGGNG